MNSQVEIFFNFQGVDKNPIKVCLHDDQPINLNEVSAAAKESNTSYEYSGRHDHGILPILKSNGSLVSKFILIRLYYS